MHAKATKIFKKVENVFQKNIQLQLNLQKTMEYTFEHGKERKYTINCFLAATHVL